MVLKDLSIEITRNLLHLETSKEVLGANEFARYWMLLNTAVEILEDTDMEGAKGTPLFLSLRKHHRESYINWWLWLSFNLIILGR